MAHVGSRQYPKAMEQVRSRQRVIDHGEVFTPRWMVDAMLDLVKAESERIESRFLEPACGSGNFLIPVLERKLTTVKTRYGKSEFENLHFALLALMSIYGIELLEDNTVECRANLLATFSTYLKVSETDTVCEAARHVLSVNIVQGDALTMQNPDGTPILFPEWAYLGKGRFQRRDFRFDALTQMSLFGEGTLFESMDKAEIFRAEKDDYPPQSIGDLASRSPSPQDKKGVTD
jgi:hypothetical protein